mgnify:CR=1 FL=1
MSKRGSFFGWHSARVLGFLLIAAPLLALSGCATSPGATPGHSAKHKVVFPKGRSLGELFVRPSDAWDTVAWEPLGPARGTVTVPDDKVLLLRNNAENILPALKDLAPDALYGLDLSGASFENKDLASIAHLGTLKDLDLSETPLDDTGLRHVKRLAQLRRLDISNTKVSDTGLEMASALKRLRILDIRGTAVTEDGLKPLGILEFIEEVGMADDWGEKAEIYLANQSRLRSPQVRRPVVLTLKDAESGQPLAGVRIDVGAPGADWSVKTDAAGTATVYAPRRNVEYLSLDAKPRGYLSMRVSWRKDIAPPDTFEWAFPKGAVIGGTVQDEEGRPLENAHVHVIARTRASEESERGVAQPYAYDVVEDTDADGRWRCDGVAADLEDVLLRFEHADYLSDAIYDRSDAAPLYALEHTHVMKRGLALSGRVVGPDGNPVASAAVRQGADRWGSHYPETRTKVDGTFAFSNCNPGSVVLTVQAHGFAPDLKVVNVKPDMAPVEFALEAPRTIRGRVVDKNGNPVAGAGVSADTWRGYRTLEWRGKTDEDGRFAWDAAPADGVEFDILAEGYQAKRNHELVAGDDEHAVTLLARLEIKGAVTDAKTGEPIPEYTVIQGIDWGTDSPVYWERAREGVSGRYSIVFSEPRAAHLVRVEAEGYLPQVSRPVKDEEGTVTIDFALERGSGIAGRVVRADKTPVVGAQVALCTPGVYTRLSNGSLEQEGTAAARTTDAEGRFSFSAQIDTWMIAVVCDEGFARVNEDAFEGSADIVVKPWARVEGVVHVGSAPGAGQPMVLWISEPYRPKAPQLSFSYSAQADSEGRFVFERVVPGEASVGRRIDTVGGGWTTSHAIPFEALPGETTNLSIGGTGRPVIGRLTVPADCDREVTWGIGFYAVNTRDERPVPPEGLNDEEIERWYRESTEVKAFQRTRRSYTVITDPDGAFRVDDVPAGQYILVIQAHEINAPGRCGYGPQIGRVHYEFDIPEMPGGRSDTPLDIGTHELAVQAHLEVGQRVADFEAPGLDGGTVKLADFRGRYVLLDFWATWCGWCLKEMPTLKEIYEAHKDNPRFALISLDLDDGVDAPRKYTKENAIAWTQAYLGAWNNATLPARFGVTGIPALFLVDPEGKLVAKDLRGEELKKAVADALGANQ